MTQKVVKPIALDESFRTTEQNPQNIADVLANKLDAIKSAIENGGSGEMEAAFECHYNVTSATDIYNAMQEKKVPFFYQNGVVAQLWKVETNKYTFRTTSTRVVEGENILDIVDYIVNGSVWSTATKTISGGSSSQQAYLAKVESSVNFDTTGLSGMQSIISVDDVPADGVYQLSIFLCITPKTASATKSDLVFQFTGTSGTGMPNTTFHAVVDDSQTFAQQLSFSTTLNLKAGTNSLKMACGGLNTEYLVFVDDLTVAQLVNGVYHNGDKFEDVNDLTEANDFNVDDELLVVSPNSTRKMLWTTLANKVLGFIKSLSTTITAFRTGDVIPVDGPSGTAKMSKDSLLQEAADAALAGCLAPAFDETQAYKKYDYVIYNGKYYRFKTDRAAGAWNSSHVDVVDEDDLVLKVKAIPSTDVNDYNEVGVYEVSGTYTNMPSGEAVNNGMLVVFIARTSRKLQLLQFSESGTNSKSRIYFRSGEYGGNTWAKWAKLQDMGEALANIAPLFDATRTNSNPYKVNEWVVYNNALYKFTSEHYGAWNASHASAITLTDNVFRLQAQPSTDLNDYNATGIYEVNGTFTNYPSGETRNGSLAVFFAKGSRKFQVLQVGANTASSPSVLYFRVGEYQNNTYGKWEQIINADNLQDACRDTERIMAFRNLLANTDLNDCTACGYYSLSTQYTFTNTPPNWGYGFVVVYAMAGRVLQVAYNQGTGAVWQRSYASGAWGSWQRINGSDENCSIKYDSSDTWSITFGDFKVDLIHAINADRKMDTYNLSKITDKAGNVICPQGTDIIGPAKIDGEVDFIGGVHGYETATSVKVVCDGVVQILDSSLNITANEISIFIETSDISHVSLSEVWTREIAITIKNNEILVSSKYTITSATDLTIFRMTNGGLMAAYHDDIGSAWMPNKILSPIPTTGISNASEKNIVCEFNTKYGTIRVENIVGHELATYKGWWQNFQNETPKRLKSYFDLISSNTTVHNGDVFVGVAKYTMTSKA
jgi:hypothetical protein